MGAQPCPRVAATRQCLSCRISLMVKELGLKLSRRGIEANDLDPADADRTDAAIRGMHDETPARQPLVHIAGDDRHSRYIGPRDGFSFGHPSADEHIELLELRRPLTLVCLHTRSSLVGLTFTRSTAESRHDPGDGAVKNLENSRFNVWSDAACRQLRRGLVRGQQGYSSSSP